MAVHLEFTRKITIKSEDFDNAKRCSSEFCPIANALRREFPDEDFFDVGSNYLVVGNKKCNNVPFNVKDFIFMWDSGMKQEFIPPLEATLIFVW